MGEIHDQIFVQSRQGNTYSSIEVDMFQEEKRILGLENDILGVLRNAQFIRAVVQQAEDPVWNASLERAKGMLGMTLASSQKEKDCFLVWSAWQAELDDTIKQQEETFRVIEDWRVCSGEMRRKI